MLCALLTTTALAAPAAAQSDTTPVYHHVDENGVDLTTGGFNFSIVEGSVGTGEGEIALVTDWGDRRANNFLRRMSRYDNSGTAVIEVFIGDQRQVFTGPSAATTFASQQGNGGTVTKVNTSEYRLTHGDGVETTFGAPGEAGFCGPSTPTGCQLVALTTVEPNGKELNFDWLVEEHCTEQIEFDPNVPVTHCNIRYRLARVYNDALNSIDFNYADTPGDWHKRTGATFQSASNAEARSSSYAFPASGVTEVTDIGGRTWRFGADSIRRPGSTSDNITVTRDSSRAITSLTSDGVTTNYARTVSGSTATMLVTNALNQQTTVVSDLTIGRPTSVTDPLNRTTSFTYDAYGRLSRATAPLGNYVEHTYDARGNVIQSVQAAQPGSGAANIVVSATYAASCSNAATCNQPLTTTDARGNVTDYNYAAHGGLLSVTAPAGANGVRPQTRYSYSSVSTMHVPTGVSTCRTTANCVGTADETRTTIAYNAQLAPTSVTTAAGDNSLTATQTMTYDGWGNVETVDGPLPGSADTVRYRYDAARQRVGTVSPDPDGTGPLPPRATRVTYRPDGQVSRTEAGITNGQSDADWANFIMLEQTDTGFDADGRPVTTSHAAGGAMHSVSQTSYDALGRTDCVARRMNPASWSNLPASACTHAPQGSFGPDRITRTVRDAAGQVTQVRSALGTPLEAADVTTTYSANGQALTVTDAENNRTSYEHDGHGRLRRTYFPLAEQDNASNAADYVEIGYDPAGNIITRRDRAGTTTTFTFDALGRMITRDRPGTEDDATYGHDLLGRLRTTTDFSKQLSFAYDALGRNTEQTSRWGTIQSEYDLAGRRTLIRHPDGFFVQQDYLVTGEMRRIRENGSTSGIGVLATYDYDLLGRRTSLTRGNGTVSSYSYDPASRLASLEQNVAGGAHDLTLGFTYNPAGQIVSNTRSNDLFSVTPTAGVQLSPVNGLNQVTALNDAATAHDSRGNMTNDGTASYVYNSQNLMMNGAGVRLNYDAQFRLTVVNWGPAADQSLRFDYDGMNMIAEYVVGARVRRHVHGPGANEPLVQYEGSGTSDRRFLHADERGSIVAHSDSAGNVVAINRYDEYGQPSSGNAGTFQYTGQMWLPQIGLYYYRARMYNQRIGRFMQTDPLGYGDGMNMYGYVGGDPVNNTDPQGTCAHPGRGGSAEAVSGYETCMRASAMAASDQSRALASELASWTVGQMLSAQGNSNIQGYYDMYELDVTVSRIASDMEHSAFQGLRSSRCSGQYNCSSDTTAALRNEIYPLYRDQEFLRSVREIVSRTRSTGNEWGFTGTGSGGAGFRRIGGYIQGNRNSIPAARVAQRARAGADIFFHTHPNRGGRYAPTLSTGVQSTFGGGDLGVAYHNNMLVGAIGWNGLYYWFDARGMKR